MPSNEEIFESGGILDTYIEDYSPREGQIRMADDVASAFNEGAIAVIEAGTGTGKSYAYLAPALSLLRDSPEARVIVATSTITLQKQLFDKDIPLLIDALGTDPDAAILYGRSNYCCIKRVEEMKDERALELDDPESDASHVVEWMLSTESGSVWDCRDWHVRRAWKDILSDDRHCDGRRCPYVSQCFYFRARKNAARSRLLVTNHHLFLIDVKHRMETGCEPTEDAILPAYTHVVLDEAHHLEDEATEILSSFYSRESMEKSLEFITFRNKKNAGMSIIELLTPQANYRNGPSEALAAIRRVREMAEKFEKVCWDAFAYEKGDEILFTPQVFGRSGILRDMAGDLGDALEDLSKRLSNLCDEEKIEDEERTDWENILRTAGSMHLYADCLIEFSGFADFNSRIPYMERNREKRTVSLKICPMDVGPMLESIVYSNVTGMAFCSATLSVNGSFDFYKKRVGLSNLPVRENIYPSPFNYRENLMLLCPMDGMQYSQNDQDGKYRDYIVESCQQAIASSSGGALVLFTNRKFMEACYDEVVDLMPDLTIYCQNRDHNRSELLRRFKTEKDSCLFATASFWEGIDAPGDTLRLVIIVKIPFPVPSAPIFAARSNALGPRAFPELSLPHAAIKLKQGIGRLIRTESDKGVVVILDPRMITKYYGPHLLRSLPECFIPEEVTLSSLGRRIEDFLY